MTGRLSVGLVHHPVLDAKGETSTSTLTTMDVHDLSRSARTYGCDALYLVHPVQAQRDLAHRIVDHWTHGSSAKRIPDRKEALAIVKVVATIDEARAAMTEPEGEPVEVWVTAARSLSGKSLSWPAARARLRAPGPRVLTLFGTSWGLAREVIDRADALLEPIQARDGDWNHLSVRAACAITLDRLLGP